MSPVKILYRDFNSEEHAEVKQNMMVIIIKQTNKNPNNLEACFSLEMKKCPVSVPGFLPPHTLLSLLQGKGKEACRDIFFILFYCSFSLTCINFTELEFIFNRVFFKHAFEHFCCVTVCRMLLCLIILKQTALPLP